VILINIVHFFHDFVDVNYIEIFHLNYTSCIKKTSSRVITLRSRNTRTYVHSQAQFCANYNARTINTAKRGKSGFQFRRSVVLAVLLNFRKLSQGQRTFMAMHFIYLSILRFRNHSKFLLLKSTMSFGSAIVISGWLVISPNLKLGLAGFNFWDVYRNRGGSGVVSSGVRRFANGLHWSDRLSTH
jgi:hypothetical protein